MDKSESIDGESYRSCILCFRIFFFLLRHLLFDLLYFLSSDELYLLVYESENYGSDSGSSGTCNFPFCFEDSVGRVSGVGSGFFVPMLVESKCVVVTFVVFVPI